MIKFTSTKINGKAKKGDKNEKEYKNYPIKSFSFEDIWAGFSAKPPKQEKITRCVIVSAYTDLDWIHQAVQYIQEHKKGCVEIRFYLDFFASKFSILPDVKKQMIKLNKEIRKMDPNGGIFLVKKGQLFHSKIIITQTEKRCKVIVGSINFTKKAFEGNEEIALVDDFDDMTNYPHYTWQIELYIEKMSKIAENVSDIKLPTEYNSLRSRLMDGKLYWESNEYSPFAFNLGFPPKILKEIEKKISKKEPKENEPSLTKYIDTSLKNSLQLQKLMKESNEYKSADNGNEESNDEENVKWKSYAIKSAYGFWVPRNYFGCVQAQLDRITKRKRKALDEICSNIKVQNEIIEKEFTIFLGELKNTIGDTKEVNDCIDKIQKRWVQWYKKLKEKLGIGIDGSSNINDEYVKIKIEKYKQKLCQPFLEESVPDIWNDEFSREEFEDSLISTIRYYSQCKERRLWIIKQILNVKNINVNDEASILEALQNCKYEQPKAKRKCKT